MNNTIFQTSWGSSDVISLASLQFRKTRNLHFVHDRDAQGKRRRNVKRQCDAKHEECVDGALTFCFERRSSSFVCNGEGKAGAKTGDTFFTLLLYSFLSVSAAKRRGFMTEMAPRRRRKRRRRRREEEEEEEVKKEASTTKYSLLPPWWKTDRDYRRNKAYSPSAEQKRSLNR